MKPRSCSRGAAAAHYRTQPNNESNPKHPFPKNHRFPRTPRPRIYHQAAGTARPTPLHRDWRSEAQCFALVPRGHLLSVGKVGKAPGKPFQLGFPDPSAMAKGGPVAPLWKPHASRQQGYGGEERHWRGSRKARRDSLGRARRTNSSLSVSGAPEQKSYASPQSFVQQHSAYDFQVSAQRKAQQGSSGNPSNWVSRTFPQWPKGQRPLWKPRASHWKGSTCRPRFCGVPPRSVYILWCGTAGNGGVQHD